MSLSLNDQPSRAGANAARFGLRCTSECPLYGGTKKQGKPPVFFFFWAKSLDINLKSAASHGEVGAQ